MPINSPLNSEKSSTIIKSLNPGDSITLNLPDDGKYFIIELKGAEVTFYTIKLNLTSEYSVSVSYQLAKKYKVYDELTKMIYEKNTYSDYGGWNTLSVSNASKVSVLNYIKQKGDEYYLVVKYSNSKKATLKVTLEATEILSLNTGEEKTIYNKTGEAFVYRTNLKEMHAYNISITSNVSVITKAEIKVEFGSLDDNDVVGVYALDYKTGEFIYIGNATNLPSYWYTVTFEVPINCLNVDYSDNELHVSAQIKFVLENGSEQYVYIEYVQLYVYLVDGNYLYEFEYVWRSLNYLGDREYVYISASYDEPPKIAGYTILIDGYKYTEGGLITNVTMIIPVLNDSELTVVLDTTYYAINASICLRVDNYTSKFIVVEPGEKETVVFDKEEDFIIAYDVERSTV